MRVAIESCGLHTHVVAANLTRGPDGRFTALFGAPIYQAAKTGGYLYQAHLRAEISGRLSWTSGNCIAKRPNAP